MLNTPYFADIHLHPIMKSSNWTKEDGEKNPWETFNHITPETSSARWGSIASKDMSKFSQANFYKLIEGKVRIACISLYPIERGFVDIRNLPQFITSVKAKNELFAIGSGIGYKRAEKLASNCDYFEELLAEYNYLKKHEGLSPCGKYSYKLVCNFEDLQKSLAKKKSWSSYQLIQ